MPSTKQASLPSIFRHPINKDVLGLFLVAVIPLVLAVFVLHLRDWDLSVPLIYRNSDDIWQLVLTKVLRDTGWILSNPFLGAPDIANWHHNAAAQTSALHSVLMLGLSFFINDAVKIQQIYYLLNFSLIAVTSFVTCRLLSIARLPAFCVGLLFAFTTFRLNEMLYAFLSNYFMVPLALVPVIWIMTGVFRQLLDQTEAVSTSKRIVQLLLSRQFLLGLVFIALMTMSDGYYAFFTLLLLGFATFVRLLSGDIKSPLSLLVPAIYITSLIAISLALSLPLLAYKNSHLEEFFPNGIEDPSLIKHPFEAEVYSSTLKLLIAPIPNHRIKFLGDVGKWVVETSDGARLFKNGRNLVPLGTLGSILFIISLTYLAVPALRKRWDTKNITGENDQVSFGDAAHSLIFFIFLCSILGGIGTLVALVFPTIRGYDRFPLFMIFILFAAGASYASSLLSKATPIRYWTYSAGLLLVTFAALFDQIPMNADIANPQKKSIFLAERNFVSAIETTLPKGAMVYQYPHSQYLEDSKYYGWGSFSHVRLYLHSVGLHWSNGAAKNSAVENWHLRIVQLPLDEMLTEIEAAGFAGLVVDRAVVPQSEYLLLKQKLAERNEALIEDDPSHLSFSKLKNNGFRIEYDHSYRDADQIIITDKTHLRMSALSQLVDKQELSEFLAKQPADLNTLVIKKSDQPQIFLDGSLFTRGVGQTKIFPLTDMKGEMSCDMNSDKTATRQNDTITITLKNQSAFNWKLNTGIYPIRIGVHLRGTDDTLLRWDDGMRISTELPTNTGAKIPPDGVGLFIAKGSVAHLQVPLSQLNIEGLKTSQQGLIADFRMVQDGHAWFEHLGCKVAIRN